MVRVIYRWKVALENIEVFRKIWSLTPNRINELIAGARGSSLLQTSESKMAVLTIAKWDSLADWKNF